MKIIPVKILHKKASRPAYVDDWDYEFLKTRSWSETTDGYPNASFKNQTFRMHRLIIWHPPGLHTDHIDGNKFNNQKSNLRICTPAQNSVNRDKKIDNTSGFKGVYWSKASNRWITQMMINSKMHFLGAFDTKIEAAEAYNA